MSLIDLPSPEMTAEELAARVGAVPLWRVRINPSPGTADEADVERVRREESRLCELIDGVLVEKAVSNKAAFLAMVIGRLLGNFVEPRKLGWILGPDGFVWLLGKRLRAPDVSFIGREQLPDHRLPDQGYVHVAAALAVEIFSPGNTAREMERKRDDFFSAGTQLFWIVYPDRREIEVFVPTQTPRTLREGDVLDAANVLPGFSVPVSELFANLDLS
jgi:Uma2 family endonuclease